MTSSVTGRIIKRGATGRIRTSNSPRSNDGFSLAEILIALFIATLILGVGVVTIRGRFESEARRVANRLNAAIRFLYHRAAAEGKTYRLAVNLDDETYWVEVAEGEALIAPDGAPKTDVGDKKTAAGDTNAADAEGEAKPVYRSPTATAFGPAPNLPRGLAQPVAMPRKVVIHDCWTSQAKAAITGGTVYMHFFPQGYAEPTIINLSDTEGNRFLALEVNPFTGFSKVYREQRERK